MTDNTPLVLDLGTGYLKVGRSSSPIPEFVLPNVVGRPVLRSDEALSQAKLKDLMISDEILPVRQYLDLSSRCAMVSWRTGMMSHWFWIMCGRRS